jgi:hypothetical protein
MIKSYVSFINERLGIPDGIIENAQNLFDLIIKRLDELGDKVISNDEDIEYYYPIDRINIDFGNFKVKDVDIGFNFYTSNKDFEILSMNVFTGFMNEEKYFLKYEKDKKSKHNSKINIVYVVKTGKTKFSDIKNHLMNDKSKNIGSLAHELKHMYDKYMFGKNWFSQMADYSTFADKRFGISPIDEFIYLLYLTTQTENLVRSTEIGAEIMELGITKSEFKTFLENTRLYPNLTMGKEFGYKKMKSELYNHIDSIKKAFDNENIEYENDDNSIVDQFLELIYINITMESIDKLKRMLGIANLFGMEVPTKGITSKDDYLKKYIKKKKFKNKEDFFGYWEKYINFTSDKVFKKVSKLYDMCKDDNVNPLHDKITKKEKSVDDNNSIINPELYDKYVAGKEKIKKYENFKYKK